MNINIEEVKDYSLSYNNRSKVFSVYSAYFLDRVKENNLNTIKNMFRFMLGILPYIEENNIKEYLTSSTIFLKTAVNTLERFKADDCYKRFEYSDFIYKMPILLGYDDYIRFYINVYKCFKESKPIKESTYSLMKAVFERTKEKCKDLCIYTPSIEELQEMINNPDGDLCSKYEIIVNLYNEYKLSNWFTINDMPFLIRSSKDTGKGNRINATLIRPVQWDYNRNKYLELRGISK